MKDFLLEVMENDELASSLKVDFLNQVNRTFQRNQLVEKREEIRVKAYKYDQAARNKMDAIDVAILKLNKEENQLFSIVDQYDDEINGTPRFTQETIELLVQFLKEYRTGE